MKMDPTTESIAHFIGLFELSTEELRLRQEYLEFTLKRAAETEAPPIEPAGVRLLTPHDTGRYDPGLAYEPQAPELPPVDPARMTGHRTLELPAPPDLEPDEPGEVTSVHAPVMEAAPFSFPLLTPGSVVSVTLQAVTLHDDDLFLSGLGARFVDPAVLHGALGEIVNLAEALVGFEMPGLPQGSDWIGFAQDMLARMNAAPPTREAAEIATFRGGEAQGIIVDGVVSGEAPVWTDLLPAYLQPEPPEDDIEEGGSGEPGEHDFSRDFGGHAANPFALDPGTEIVAGANTAINEIVLGSQWIDAPVIVVRGDVAKFDAISQVNVLVEHDTVDGVAAGQQSLARNVAEITTESSADPDAPPPDDVMPGGWEVVRVEADLLQVNWVKQFTFATDFDRAEITVSGQATFLGFGENEIVNSAVLNEFGYHYDLIFVAGDMIDGTVVSQKNVLFDSDAVTTRDPMAPRPAQTATEAQPAAAAHDPDAGATVEPFTSEAGDVGGAVEEADAPGGDDATQGDVADAAPALSLADNLLLNQATLKTTGADTFVEMTEAFAATADRLAEGAETIAREVAEDALFAGKEALRILQIDGDLVKLNLFEQTNIVGDADQIRLEMQALRDQLETEMNLVAGSNALVNLATAIEYGVDSTIMAGGDVYDDALIHQAEFIDIDAAPNGVAVSALANEAVAAFLCDGMVERTEVTDEIVPTENHEACPQLDVMQTALA